jgi:DNA end-binding protein Ku
MARALWTGSISFGLVNVPVKVYPAIREHDVRFHQLAAKTGNRIRYERVDEKTGKPVEYEDIVKGYEVADGRYVEITPEELEALKPRSTRTIDIEDFVDLDAIDPIYFQRTYYLAPQDNEAAKKAYALLLKAMQEQGKVGIGRVVMRDKQYLAAIRPMDGVLSLSTMLFADEVVDRRNLPDVPSRLARPSKREVDMAARLVDSLSTSWDPNKYKDTYQDELKRRIRAKERGKEITVSEPEREETKVVDLMEALEASLANAKKRPAKKPSRRTTTTTTKARQKRRTAA